MQLELQKWFGEANYFACFLETKSLDYHFLYLLFICVSYDFILKLHNNQTLKISTISVYF